MASFKGSKADKSPSKAKVKRPSNATKPNTKQIVSTEFVGDSNSDQDGDLDRRHVTGSAKKATVKEEQTSLPSKTPGSGKASRKSLHTKTPDRIDMPHTPVMPETPRLANSAEMTVGRHTPKSPITSTTLKGSKKSKTPTPRSALRLSESQKSTTKEKKVPDLPMSNGSRKSAGGDESSSEGEDESDEEIVTPSKGNRKEVADKAQSNGLQGEGDSDVSSTDEEDVDSDGETASSDSEEGEAITKTVTRIGQEGKSNEKDNLSSEGESDSSEEKGESSDEVEESGEEDIPKKNEIDGDGLDSDSSDEESETSQDEAISGEKSVQSSSRSGTLSQKYEAPPGFEKVNIQSSSQLSKAFSKEELMGKEIWHITAPADVPIDMIKEASMGSIARREVVLEYNEKEYQLVKDNGIQNPTLFLPLNTGSEYRTHPVDFVHSLHLRQKVKSLKADGGTPACARLIENPVRPQPEGLRMRYMPFGLTSGGPEELDSDYEETVQGDSTKAAARDLATRPIHQTSKQIPNQVILPPPTDMQSPEKSLGKKRKRDRGVEGINEIEIDIDPSRTDDPSSPQERKKKRKKKSNTNTERTFSPVDARSESPAVQSQTDVETPRDGKSHKHKSHRSKEEQNRKKEEKRMKKEEKSRKKDKKKKSKRSEKT